MKKGEGVEVGKDESGEKEEGLRVGKRGKVEGGEKGNKGKGWREEERVGKRGNV